MARLGAKLIGWSCKLQVVGTSVVTSVYTFSGRDTGRGLFNKSYRRLVEYFTTITSHLSIKAG